MKFFSIIRESTLNFFGLTRIISNVKNIAIVLLAFYLSNAELDWPKLILGIVSMSFIFSSIYTYNNLEDSQVDEQNSYKRHYSKAVKYFGEKIIFIMITLFVILGLIMGIFINIYFAGTLFILLAVGFLYSSKHTRLKDKFILDVLFGATFTYFFRFLAAWFVFSVSMPPLLPILALVFAKNGGYLLYKQADKPFLLSLQVKNTITVMKKKTLIIFSIFSWIVVFLSFLLLCLNARYIHLKVLGYLPEKFLILIPFAIPPLIVVYFYSFGRLKNNMRHLRILGFIYWLLVIVIFGIYFYD